ncbi:MAG TPA: hypothetical protein VG844_18210 [Terracidiphilus sp.]|jgi:hypothetical protein|nr:hypothetical protein [Terracidiphilus sp.]
MAKRGKILRDPTNGPGLVVVEGQQYTFALEGIWKSASLPQPGVVVDVDFAADGSVIAVTAVPESQLAKEQAEQALSAAKEKGAAIASTAVAQFGLPTLIAAGLVIVGWFFMATVSLNAGFAGKFEFTFWHVLTLLNSSNLMDAMQSAQGKGSAGFYGFLAIAALAGPFISAFWKDKRALLGGLLPVLFMLLVAILVKHSLSSATADMPAEFAKEMSKQISKQISIGMGAYLSLLSSLYLGFVSVKKFLAAKASS